MEQTEREMQLSKSILLTVLNEKNFALCICYVCLLTVKVVSGYHEFLSSGTYHFECDKILQW